MKRKIKVICECCKTEHVLSRSEVGRAFIQLRKTPNTKEQQQRAGARGAEVRWGNGTDKVREGIQSRKGNKA